jgi:LysM domain
MAISRLGRTAVAVAGLAALAGSVIWFGILKREDAPGQRKEAAPRGPTEAPASSQPAETAPTAPPPEGRVERVPDAPAAPSTTAPTAPLSSAPPAPAEAAPATPARPSATPPTFDVVRVEPSGESVIAGRTAPGATVELLRNGKSHARIAADDSGLFAFVPPPFPPGSHEVVLQSIAPDGTRTQSRESLTIAIPEKKDTKPLVALTTPDRPTVVISEPEAAGPGRPPASPDSQTRTAAAPEATRVEPARPSAAPPSAAAPGPSPPAAAPAASPPPPANAAQQSAPSRQAAAPAPSAVAPAGAPPATASAPRPRANVRIASVEAEEGGRLFVSGQAAPGATVRLYLNETMIAPGGAGTDGRVSFAIGRGVRPGSYRVRLDDVDPVSGEVKSRAEVEFRVPPPVTVELPPAAQPSLPQAGAPAPAASALPPPSSPLPRPAPAPAASASAPSGSAGVPPRGSTAQSPAPAAGAASQRPPATAAEVPLPPAIAAPPAAEQPSPSTRTAAAPANAQAAPSPPRELDPGTVLVPEVNTAIVSRGDSLWRISRRIYGSGVRYTVIYEANEDQIRNRHLIYPGQVFVLPAETNPEARR